MHRQDDEEEEEEGRRGVTPIRVQIVLQPLARLALQIVHGAASSFFFSAFPRRQWLVSVKRSCHVECNRHSVDRCLVSLAELSCGNAHDTTSQTGKMGKRGRGRMGHPATESGDGLSQSFHLLIDLASNRLIFGRCCWPARPVDEWRESDGSRFGPSTVGGHSHGVAAFHS